MIKFLHCADLHLDSPFKGLNGLPEGYLSRLFESTFLSFQRLIDTAIAEKVDFVIIAGDLYDSSQRSLKAQSFLKQCFQRLENKQIQVYICHGNHDPLDGQWVNLEWPNNVHFFSGTEVETVCFEKNGQKLACIHGFSYETTAILDNRTALYPEKSDALYHIGVLHGQADGYSEHSRYAPFLVSELIKKGYDYWALGHIHKRVDLSVEPPIRYSGNIQGRHRNETGEKGGYIVSIDKHNVKSRFVSTCDIVWEEKVIDLESIESVQALITHCEEIKSAYQIAGKGVLLSIRLIGRTKVYRDLGKQFFLEELQELLADDDFSSSFVYVVSIKNETSPLNNEHERLIESKFFQELLEVIGTEAHDDVIEDIKSHRTARRYLGFTDEDWNEIKNDAAQLLMSELYKG